MKSSPHRSETSCTCRLNKAFCLGLSIAVFGVVGGGLIVALPTRLGIDPEDARLTGVGLSLASLAVGLLFVAVGVTQKLSGKPQTCCTPSGKN